MLRTGVFAELWYSPNKYSCTKAGKGKRRGTCGREKEGGGTLTLTATYTTFTRYKYQIDADKLKAALAGYHHQVAFSWHIQTMVKCK